MWPSWYSHQSSFGIWRWFVKCFFPALPGSDDSLFVPKEEMVKLNREMEEMRTRLAVTEEEVMRQNSILFILTFDNLVPLACECTRWNGFKNIWAGKSKGQADRKTTRYAEGFSGRGKTLFVYMRFVSTSYTEGETDLLSNLSPGSWKREKLC